jgi:hypothetical protein
MIEQSRYLMEHISGFNSVTHEILDQLKEHDPSDPKITQAYDDSLFHQEILYGLEEHLRFMQAGYANRDVVGDTPAGYLESVKKEVEAFRTQLPQRAEQILIAAQSGNYKLLTTGEEDLKKSLLADPANALSTITNALTKRLDAAEPKLLEAAAKREALYKERLSLLGGHYRPKQRKLREKLIVCLEAGGINSWFAFTCTGGLVTTDESINSEALKELKENEKLAKSWIKQGWNIMFFNLRPGIELPVQLETIVTKHFEAYLESLDSLKK